MTDKIANPFQPWEEGHKEFYPKNSPEILEARSGGSPASPTEEIIVTPYPLRLKVRRVVQPKLLTARGVYVEQGGGILETLAGDVYLTKAQLECLFYRIDEETS